MSMRTPPEYFVGTVGGPRIVLLNLQCTLTEAFLRGKPRPKTIMEREQYRPFVLDWIRQVRECGWEIHLVTARPDELRDATLDSLQQKTGWQPDCSWFRTDEPRSGRDVKRAYLHRLIRERRPSALYALEYKSARDISRMYEERGICCRRVSGPDDLPHVAEFSHTGNLENR